MESELIIDGQVIDLSEKQESAEEVTTEQPEAQPDEHSSAEAPEQVEAESEQAEEQPEDYSLRIGDEEIPLNEDSDDHIDGQPAPQWVKDLRKGFKEKDKEVRELRRQLEEIQAKPAEQAQATQDVIPERPKLEDFYQYEDLSLIHI